MRFVILVKRCLNVNIFLESEKCVWRTFEEKFPTNTYLWKKIFLKMEFLGKLTIADTYDYIMCK